jgi:hypothetical protein
LQAQVATVTNLSDLKLSNEQLKVLTRGLTFIPSHTRINYNTTRNEILTFERKLQLHYYFNKNKRKSDTSAEKEKHPFESNPDFWPKSLNPKITNFCTEIHKIIHTLHNNKYQPNLTVNEIKALQTLHNNPNIIIKKGDKGAGIVIMNRIDYEKKVNDMLSDTNTYTQISTDISSDIKHQTDVHIATLRDKGYLNKKQYNNLTSYSVQCPKFYGVPKVHKPDCPLRPIVSQMNGPTRKLHDLLDTYLAVAEKQIPYLLQDTTSFLNLLNNKQHLICNNSILVTLDVTSLYTNIPQEEGSREVSDFYEETLQQWNTNSSLKPIDKKELAELLLFTLNNTVFTYNDKYYKQNYGCTMGAQSSVKYANIYMHKFLTKFRETYKQYLPEFFARLVDDIFTIWNADLDSLLAFVEALNKFHPTIKFELKYSYTEIQYHIT